MKRKREKHNFMQPLEFRRNFAAPRWLPMKKKLKTTTSTLLFLFFFFFLFFGALLFLGFIDSSTFSAISPQNLISIATKTPKPEIYAPKCINPNTTQTCPLNYPTSHNPTINPDPSSKNPTCPPYFRWIHEDLRPWKDKGITRDMIQRARKTAHFRVVIVDGKAYVEKYRKSIQTRDMFSLWGILQLMRFYPTKLPDLEIIFDCGDRPVVPSKKFRGHKVGPPPVFSYCSDDWSLDIVFPDWSFWGWAEINIKPWRSLVEDIKEGNKRSKWEERVPYAYWKGNPNVAETRKDLLNCNLTDNNNWNSLLYIQDWDKESIQGYKQSNLEDQCTHRYKIYIEGWAWSVSEKYILACDSMTLLIKPHYYDFFIRGMEPLKHYWPIRDKSKCTSLKFAVEWGNNNTHEAQAIGEAASKFIQEDMKMDYIYDYMFHLLNEYAKLLKFKPTIPPRAVELCSETMSCSTSGTWKKFMDESLVKSPSDKIPCTMPLPFDPPELKALLDRKAKSTRQVEIWEDEYWHSHEKRH